MTRLITSVMCALAVVVASTIAALAERRVALVIGNSQYRNPSLSLPNPKNDAEDVAATLKTLGFDEVIHVVDANKSNILSALARFGRQAKQSDTALFYYAGHAFQRHGRNYLMPVDAELEDEFSIMYHMVSFDEVRVALDQASGVRIMILDACRNNPLSDRLSNNVAPAPTLTSGNTRGLARADKTHGLVVAYATAAEDVAMDGPTGRNSPFTRALLRQMKEPGLDITRMFQRVANDVRTETQGRQVPELSISLGEEYYLNRADGLMWQRLRDAGDIPAIRDFIDKYPHSRHAWDAKKWLDDRERWLRDRETQQRLEYERERAERDKRELEERLKQREAEFEERRRQFEQQAAEAERRREAEAARQRAEREREAAQRTEDAKRLEQIEAEKKQLRERAEQQRAEQKAKEESERREREQAARRQTDIQSAAAEAEAKRIREAAEAERRQQTAAREAEEAQKRKEEQERMAALEREKREAVKREQERKIAEKKREELERACERERSGFKMIEGDLTRLRMFIARATCDEVRQTATDRIAALDAQAQTCKSEDNILALLKGIGPDKRDQLVQFEKQMSCEKLRPSALAILAKLDAMPPVSADGANNPRDLIRNVQIGLRKIGCFRGAETGAFDAATRAAVKRYREHSEGDEADLDPTPNLLASINAAEPGVCPTSCPSGQVARGNTCIAEKIKKQKQPAQAARPEKRRVVTREAPPRQRAPRAAAAAPVARPESPRASAGGSTPRTIGVGF